MRITAFLLFLLGIFYFSSCASIARDRRLHAYLTDNSRFILLAPEGIENSMDMAQYISASYGGREYLLNAWVMADETAMEIILLNEMGANMGELTYRDGDVNFSSSIFPMSVRPEYIVADFQLCFYNPLLLSQALKDCGLTLELQGSTRRILRGRDLIIEIEKSENTVRLVNHLRRYAYTIEGYFL